MPLGALFFGLGLFLAGGVLLHLLKGLFWISDLCCFIKPLLRGKKGLLGPGRCILGLFFYVSLFFYFYVSLFLYFYRLFLYIPR